MNGVVLFGAFAVFFAGVSAGSVISSTLADGEIRSALTNLACVRVDEIGYVEVLTPTVETCNAEKLVSYLLGKY